MIASLVLTALGFIFIFVANAENTGAPSPGLISFACVSHHNTTSALCVLFAIKYNVDGPNPHQKSVLHVP